MAEFVAAVAVTALTLPVLRMLLVARGILDVPNARSSHAVPIARGGGLGCALGVGAGLVAAQVTGRSVSWGLCAVIGGVTLVGLADDLLVVPPVARLALQAGAGACAGLLVGATAQAVLAGALVTVLLVNTVNFMDGIDGITGLTVVVWGAAAAVAGAVEGSAFLTVLGLVSTGAALGFLPFNLPVPRLFLGDSGSYLFGSLCAVGWLVARRDGVPVVLVVAPLSLYLLDVLSTLAGRARRGEPLMTAHRDHVYQRLLITTGWPHVGVAALVAGAAAIVTVAWYGGWPAGVLVTLAVATTYLSAPRILTRRRRVRVQGARP